VVARTRRTGTTTLGGPTMLSTRQVRADKAMSPLETYLRER
jgi:hypothetical protein